jgi:hypothetical protein
MRHLWFIPKFLALALALMSALAIQTPGRGQGEQPIYLPLAYKAFTIASPVWAWTSDCAKTSAFEGETPDGGTIGQVARKLAFVAEIPDAAGKPYSYQWIIDGDDQVAGPAQPSTVSNAGFISSGALTYGPNGNCQDPQPAGVYQVRIVFEGKVFYTSRLTITP